MIKQLFRQFQSRTLLSLYILCCLGSVSYGQNETNKKCIVLKKIVETEVFQQQLYVCKNTHEELLLIDTTGFIDTSFFIKIACRDILVETHIPENKKIILFSGIKSKNNKYVLGFYRPSGSSPKEIAGPTLHIEVKARKNKVKIIKYTRGDF